MDRFVKIQIIIGIAYGIIVLVLIMAIYSGVDGIGYKRQLMNTSVSQNVNECNRKMSGYMSYDEGEDSEWNQYSKATWA